MYSTQLAEILPNLPHVDILFIDGDHRRSVVESDLEHYIPYVKPGGYIVCDDYQDLEYSPEVRPAVDAWVAKIAKFSKITKIEKYKFIGSLPNTTHAYSIIPKSHFNNYIIQRNIMQKYNNYNAFAIVIATYWRTNEKSFSYLTQGVLKTLQCQNANWKLFVMGDDYTNTQEFENIRDIFLETFPSEKCYFENIPKSYRGPQQYFTIQQNLWSNGGIMARYQGIQRAISEGYQFFVHLDDDDTWTENHLQNLYDIIQKFPNVDFIYTASKYRCFGQDLVLPRPYDFNSVPKIYYNNKIPEPGNIVHSSWCINLDSIGLFFLSLYERRMQYIEKIQRKEIPEKPMAAFDLWVTKKLFKMCKKGLIQAIYIPEITCVKSDDLNYPEFQK